MVFMMEQECCTPSDWLSVSLSIFLSQPKGISPQTMWWSAVQFSFLPLLICWAVIPHTCRTDRRYMAENFRFYDFGSCKFPFRPILSSFELCPKHMYHSLGFILHLQLLSKLSSFILGQYIRSNDVLCMRLKQDKCYLVIIKKKNLQWVQILFQSVLVLLLAIKSYCSIGVLFWKKQPLFIFPPFGSAKNKFNG